MQHLTPSYEGLKIDSISYRNIDRCLNSEHGYMYQDFITFPASHGYMITEGYRLEPMDANPDRSQSCNGQSLDEDTFLQAWLFFGLIRCVVREDESILKEDQLKFLKRLNTKDLPEAVKKWCEYLEESAKSARSTAEMRCIEAVQMLTLAKRVIITNMDDKKSNKNDPRDLSLLCLMVLGETLSSALAYTMNKVQINVRGWQLDDHGWGPPRWVLNQMNDRGWCPRYQEVLKGQVGKSATLLYTSLKLGPRRNSTEADFHKDLKCSKDKCNFIEAHHAQPQNERGYRSLHREDCGGEQDGCRMLGPDNNALLEILESSEEGQKVFPLFRYHKKGQGDARIEVEPWSGNLEMHFVTISHVWAHGMGNKEETKLWDCQLRHIDELVRAIFDEKQIQFHQESPQAGPLFWLDTLAIPVERPDDDGQSSILKQKAISSIYHVFDMAKYGLIIDQRLLRKSADDDQLSIGIRLLSSAWMKRLWTLQEAFVTKSLYMAGRYKTVRDIDNLWGAEGPLDRPPDIMKDSLAASIQMKLSQNLMDAQRKTRKQDIEAQSGRTGSSEAENTPGLNHHQREHQKKNWSMLIADAWNSARYRDVGRLDNETLALTSLLDLPVPPRPERQPDTPEMDLSTRRDELMKLFWESVSNKRDLQCAIPTGMIFTPGERISLPGFGWAPRTWMSGAEETYPYPLSTPNYTEELLPEGLMVRYPGFLMHVTLEKYRDILGMDIIDRSFIFSISAGLYDWYVARILDSDTSATRQFVEELLARANDGTMPKLGIILSRPRPVEYPPEVALLVAIYPSDRQHGEGSQKDTTIDATPLYCKIIRRLQISRVSMLEGQPHGQASNSHVIDRYKDFNAAIVGETLDDNQRWCVDGYTRSIDRDEEKYFSERNSQKNPNERDPTSPIGTISRKKRMITRILNSLWF